MFILLIWCIRGNLSSLHLIPEVLKITSISQGQCLKEQNIQFIDKIEAQTRMHECLHLILMFTFTNQGRQDYRMLCKIILYSEFLFFRSILYIFNLFSPWKISILESKLHFIILHLLIFISARPSRQVHIFFWVFLFPIYSQSFRFLW